MIDGLMFAIMVITVAAAEYAISLAVIQESNLQKT